MGVHAYLLGVNGDANISRATLLYLRHCTGGTATQLSYLGSIYRVGVQGPL